MPIYPYEAVTPEIEKDVLIAPGAMVVGRVKIGEGSSVWYNAVIRGDVHDVVIGRYTSIQDGTIIHEDSGRGSGLERRSHHPLQEEGRHPQHLQINKEQTHAGISL